MYADSFISDIEIKIDWNFFKLVKLLKLYDYF